MRDPFGWLPIPHRGRAFTFLALLALVLMATLNILGVPLRNDASPAGIISYEFAGSLPAAERILGAWGEEGRVAAGLNLGLDFLFLFAYGAAIALGCVIAARSLKDRSRILGAIGTILAWAVIAAALLDVIENYALIRLLLGSGTGSLAAAARVCAAIKFSLVAVSLLYVVFGGVTAGIQRLRLWTPRA
jgi:hypothetical protein